MNEAQTELDELELVRAHEAWRDSEPIEPSPASGVGLASPPSPAPDATLPGEAK